MDRGPSSGRPPDGRSPRLFHEADDLLGHLHNALLLRAHDRAAVFGDEHGRLTDVDARRREGDGAGGIG